MDEEFGDHYCSSKYFTMNVRQQKLTLDISGVQRRLWNLFENPHDSCAAKVNMKNISIAKYFHPY